MKFCLVKVPEIPLFFWAKKEPKHLSNTKGSLNLLKMHGKSSKNILGNRGLMVIYHGTIRKQSPKKQIQVFDTNNQCKSRIFLFC